MLESSLDQIKRINATINKGSLFGAYDTIFNQVQQLLECLKTDLEKRSFMFLPPNEASYYEQEQLFGPEVFTGFRSTRQDVTEAGNCYAAGRYTACVFHCMRVVEKGLHALVRELNNKHNAGIVFRGQIEHENWGNYHH